ncbi:hypothetical protein EB061_02325 [bacterium]|jgi:hypothetical protein|nr:hypothetical protein [bacterium]
MILAGIFLLMVSLYTLFTSADALDLAKALIRVFLSVLLVVYDRFADQGVLETSVLFYSTLILVLLAFLRKEVQPDHDGS